MFCVLPGSDCGVPDVSPLVFNRIVGGVEAVTHSWPWLVSLTHRRQAWRHQCGGSVISHRWIITAAHCVYVRLDNVAPFFSRSDCPTTPAGSHSSVSVTLSLYNGRTDSADACYWWSCQRQRQVGRWIIGDMMTNSNQRLKRVGWKGLSSSSLFSFPPLPGPAPGSGRGEKENRDEDERARRSREHCKLPSGWDEVANGFAVFSVLKCVNSVAKIGKLLKCASTEHSTAFWKPDATTKNKRHSGPFRHTLTNK